MPPGERRTRRLWGVQARVIAAPGKEPRACRVIRTSLPPRPGSGLAVRGLDLESVPDATVYRNGTVETPRLRLVGTVDLWTLTLTEPATLATDDLLSDARQGDLSHLATSCADPGDAAASSAELRQLRRSVHADRDVLEACGIVVLGSCIPRGNVVVETAAAGPEEVEFLRERYGPLLLVTSWLRPLVDG